MTADRGYGEQLIEDDLRALGVRHVAIPRKGKPGKARQAAERLPRSGGPSNGGPAAKPGSAPSNANTDGTAPA